MKKPRGSKASITIEGDEVVLKIEGVTLRLNDYLAKEVGEKLFKAGCVVKDRKESR